jgi:hypothetical protein
LLDELRDPPVGTPRLLRIENRLLSILDTGDGTASLRFAKMLTDAGAALAEPSADAGPDLRIVIRGAPASAHGRARAEALEESADLILGSARPAFATLLGSAVSTG